MAEERKLTPEEIERISQQLLDDLEKDYDKTTNMEQEVQYTCLINEDDENVLSPEEHDENDDDGNKPLAKADNNNNQKKEDLLDKETERDGFETEKEELSKNGNDFELSIEKINDIKRIMTKIKLTPPPDLDERVISHFL